MRAVIDLGTNSALLLIGRRDKRGRVLVVHDEARITGLGRGVATTGHLDPARVDATLKALAEYRAIAESHGARLTAVATEGLRFAADRDEFIDRATDLLGIELRLISGDEEAELSYLSVAREEEADAPLRVVDIGGGSTELVVGRGTSIESRQSHGIGSVRLTETLVHEDPPVAAEIDAIDRAAREAFAAQPVAPHAVLHGLAGTVTTTAALLLGLQRYDREAVDGTRWSLEAIRALRDELAGVPLDQRMRACLPRGRADVIVAGITILLAAMSHCGADTLVVRDRGLRYALL
jgi:exopolyphosphatase / guanosine-5'-triphosphate,3'-diphosphate pyrophosphatase